MGDNEFEVKEESGSFNLYYDGLFLMELPLWLNDYVVNHNNNITPPEELDLEEFGLDEDELSLF